MIKESAVGGRIEPLKDWVVVEKVEDNKSGLQLPDSVKEDLSKVHLFKIVDIADTYREYCDLPDGVELKVGDVVVFEGGQAVFPLEIRSEVFLVAQARHIAFKEVGDEK